MTRRLLLSYLSLTVLVLLSLEVPLAIIYAHSERQDLNAQAERAAGAVATLVEDNLENGLPVSSPLVTTAAGRYGRATGGHVIVLDKAGVAQIDTARPSSAGRSYHDQPEVRAALDGRIASGRLPSRPTEPGGQFVAVPVASGGEVNGAVILTYSTSSVEGRIHRYWLTLAGIAVIALAAAGLVGWRFARRVTRPLQDVERAVATAGAGDLAVRAPVGGPPEVRSLAESFNGMIVKLESLMHAQEEFVADASHQLRTPLATLRLTLENLEYELADPGDLEAALREVDRLSRIVNGLLALARADRDPPARQAADLRAMAEERVALWSPLARQRNLTLSSDIDRSWWVLVTADRLEQVVDNLLENAVDASPPGGAITIAVSAADGWTELHIIDTGPGLTDEERTRAFDRFWRRGSNSGGSGIGLAIVDRLVRADGGDVELRRAAKGGLDAVVRLHPVSAPTPAPVRTG
jgi:signal transduction histidine kinase